MKNKYMYHKMLIDIMDLNNYCFIPDYPDGWSSLDEEATTNEVEMFCLKVLCNLDKLVEANSANKKS